MTVRVSDSLLYLRAREQLSQARERVAAAQERVLTGKRVVRPSDDPLASALALREGMRARRAEGHARAIDHGADALHAADGALADVGDTLTRAQELALRAASDTVGADERAAILAEVEQLRAQVLALANSESGGRYLFAGFRDGAPPFDVAGTYTGDVSAAQVEVAPGVHLTAGLTGDRVFGAAGGEDVFAALDALASALGADDVAAVRASLDGLEASRAQVTAARGELGAAMGAFDVARSVAERTHDRAIEERSDLVEIDVFEAYADLARAEQALEAAVAIASRLPGGGTTGG